METMKAIDIKTELRGLIEKETDLRILETVRALFTQKDLDPSVEKEMISRALKSEQDIKEGKVYTIEEAEARLNKRLGL
jgi:hypothetical protein